MTLHRLRHTLASIALFLACVAAYAAEGYIEDKWRLFNTKFGNHAVARLPRRRRPGAVGL
jgi:hypothetical protein